MSRRPRQGSVSYKEVDSDGDEDVLTADDDDDRVDSFGKAARLLERSRKRAGETSDDAYEPGTSRKKKTQRRDKDKGKQRAQGTTSSYNDGTANPNRGDFETVDTLNGREDDGEDEDEEDPPEFVNEFTQDLLLKLPYEMISEICSHLDLSDLIRLTKTSPVLNSFLLASSSRTLWARVRKILGFELPKEMSEIGFALTLYGSDCHYCGSKSSFDQAWLVRWCKACKGDRLIERRSLKGELGQIHPRLNECVLIGHANYDKSSNRWDKFVLDDVRQVNDDLWQCAQADEEAAQSLKATSLWSTRSRKRGRESRNLKTDHLDSFVEERRQYVKRALEERSQIEENLKVLHDEAAAARVQRVKDGYAREEERQSNVLYQLSKDHAWSKEEVGELRDKFKSKNDFWWPHSRELPDPPERMPNSAPKAWRRYKVVLLDTIAERDAKKASEERLEKLQEMFAKLRGELRRKLSWAPSWEAVAHRSKLRALYEPADADPTANTAATLEALTQIAATEVENQRVLAARDCLAAQLDAPVSTLSLKHGDYPADRYGDAFFAQVKNRFKLEYRGAKNRNGWRPFKYASFWTLQKCARKSAKFAIAPNRKVTRPAWRRAIKHVLAAAGREDATDLDELDALGAAFTWTNSPEACEKGSFTWRKMVELVERHGPEDLHLVDLKNVKIVYTAVKGKSKAEADSGSDGGAQDSSDEASDDST